MKIERGMKVRIKSTNDLLHAYEKAKTAFVVKEVYDENVILAFAASGNVLDVVIMDYEVVPFAL